MLKKIYITLLSAMLIFTQVGCATMSSTKTTDTTNNGEFVIESETEAKILKQATVAGTIGGIAITAVLLETIGKDLPLAIKIPLAIGGPLAIKKLAEFVGMEQISALREVTLSNDTQEEVLKNTRKQNNDIAKLNSDLSKKIKKYKKDKEGLPKELAQAKENQQKAKEVLKNRKLFLKTLVKDSEQYKKFEKEVKILEKENAKLASAIKQLNDLDVGAV
ncbi:hypothetical protein [Photobacterium leiognathi]|uniref:hypothetical protein n=1 Tax=Photobacterium leiognathi TaxID=553611 RepID=UPI002982338D|nr:hypothetical protein [Photobacterium leiognathi]